MYGRSQGLVGDSVDGIAKITDPSTGQVTMFVSHNGEGPTRPGFSEVNPQLNPHNQVLVIRFRTHSHRRVAEQYRNRTD